MGSGDSLGPLFWLGIRNPVKLHTVKAEIAGATPQQLTQKPLPFILINTIFPCHLQTL
jgi:hypothetical protein